MRSRRSSARPSLSILLAERQALEAGGTSQVGKNCVCSLRMIMFVRAVVRPEVGAPQLRRAPLGGSTSMITVRAAKLGDATAWLQLRRALWPEGSEAEHRDDIAQFFAGEAREPLAVLLAEDGAGCPVGCAELSIRAYAEGCRSDRVAYLEGWFVVPTARRHGGGRALIAAAGAWGRSQGDREFASDGQPDNEVAAAAHPPP